LIITKLPAIQTAQIKSYATAKSPSDKFLDLLLKSIIFYDIPLMEIKWPEIPKLNGLNLLGIRLPAAQKLAQAAGIAMPNVWLCV
jgi:hypothetical protein